MHVRFQQLCIRFADRVREIRIGHVRACPTALAFAELNKQGNRSALELHGKNKDIVVVDKKLKTTMPAICWEISNVRAAKENIEEEALWLIDVALSLLRLYCSEAPRPRPGVKPRRPVVEPHPLQIEARRSIALSDVTITTGTHSYDEPRPYLVDRKIARRAKTVKFVRMAEEIFGAPERTLAARLRQGLGWLTRGRRSQDRSERLLFFFTAIEALLGGGRSAVAERIARHVATVIEPEINLRHKATRMVRRLYAVRNELVHEGGRDVSHMDVIHLQDMVERLYKRVLKMELRIASEFIPAATFLERVDEASFGARL